MPMAIAVLATITHASPAPVADAAAELLVRDVTTRFNKVPGAQPFSQDEIEQITAGFQDACDLAVAGSDATAADNMIFLKYFPAKGKEGENPPPNTVERVFANIIGRNRQECAKSLGDILISRDFPDEENDNKLSCQDEDDLGELRLPDDDQPVMIICDGALRHGLIKRTTPNSPPAVTCDTIGDRTTWRMNTLGATILHEYTHWAEISTGPLGQPTVDGGDDIKFYGPIDTQKLAKSSLSVHIADSYVWFATEAFWSEECKKSFGRPQTGDDLDPACGKKTCQEENPKQASHAL